MEVSFCCKQCFEYCTKRTTFRSVLFTISTDVQLIEGDSIPLLFTTKVAQHAAISVEDETIACVDFEN